MSLRSDKRRRASISHKAEALASLIADAAQLLPAQEVQRLEDLDERVAARAHLSAEHTVIGFFGATGSGKSSLFNALVGSSISRVAHRRPTTSQPLAAIVDTPDDGHDPNLSLSDGAHALLDWLDISERHVVNQDAGAPGVIYLDLPDFDSVEKTNRAVAMRLAERVDVLVWVTDPEKYADGVLHREFVQRFATHDAVTIAVLNQSDRLHAGEREQVRASLEELVRADGLPHARALAVSATTGDGLEELRKEFSAVAKKKSAALMRIDADLKAEAQHCAQLLGAVCERDGCVVEGLANEVPPRATDVLEDAIAQAAQVPAISAAVGASYRKRAGAATGWPVTRWISGFRADPLSRMRIGRATQSHRAEDSEEEFVARSSLSVDAPMAVGRMNRGFDAYLDDVVGDARPPWPQRIREVAEPEREKLPETADYALTHTSINARVRSWWWTPTNVLQWCALLAAVVGLGWLLALAAFDFFQIPQPPMPMLEGLWIPIPIPTALIVFGVLLGILAGLGASFVNGLAARRHQAKAEAQLRTSIRSAIEESVGEAVGQECARATRIEGFLTTLRGA